MPHSRRQEPDLVASVFRIGLMLGGLYLLAAIVFPFFSQPIGNSHRASCMSNMRQLGLALTQYAEDYNELPPTVSATGQDWREAVYPYVKSVNVYQCPDDRRSGGNFSPINLPKSYGASTLGPGPGGKDRGAFAGPTEKPTTVMRDFLNPSQTIMVTETRGWGGADWNMVSPAFLPSTDRRLYAHFPRHRFYERPAGRLNCLFMDGHVKSLLPEETVTPTNLWTRDNTPFTGPDRQNAQAVLARAAQE